MSIAVVCTSCSAKLNAPDSAAGKRVKCPRCQTSLLVPEELPEASPFEVVDDEPQPAPKAVRPKMKATVEADEDDDDRPRRRRARDEDDDDDEEDDDRPRKKKKKKAAAVDNSMLIRNVIGGVVLLALLGVAGFVYYDKFKKKDESTASNSSDEAGVANPRLAGPAANPRLQGPAGVPGGPGGSGAPGAVSGGGLSPWSPDPNLVKELTQRAEIGDYQVLLPQKFTSAKVTMAVPPNVQVGAWVAEASGGVRSTGFSVVIEKGG